MENGNNITIYTESGSVVLSGTASHVTVSDAEKLHALWVGARILIKRKIYQSIRDVASIIKNSNDTDFSTFK